jgi:hypothetical protein
MSKIAGKKDFAITIGIFGTGFLVFLCLGWLVLPSFAYVTKKQPVDFRHGSHVQKIGIKCNTCHFFYEDGSWAGVPPLEVCADCHKKVIGKTLEEKKFFEEYIKKNREVEWALYFRQPQCVSFSHSAHVRRAKIACETCHGPQGYSDYPATYQVNIITNYSYIVYDPDIPINPLTIRSGKGKDVWGTVRMDECAECHRARGQSTACFICHK